MYAFARAVVVAVFVSCWELLVVTPPAAGDVVAVGFGLACWGSWCSDYVLISFGAAVVLFTVACWKLW